MDALLNAAFLDGGLLLDVKKPEGASDLVALVLDELAYGVMVVTQDGAILYANKAARQKLARGTILEAGTQSLCAGNEDHARALHDALGKVAEGKRSLLTLCGEGASLTLAVVPVRSGVGVPTRAALVFARAAVQESTMLGLFARNHGLTATEEHVLGILCEGYATPDIAAQMKVAVSTIRSHVRSMCAKTRSSGVRELVNRVAVLPPVASATVPDQFH